MMSYAHANTLLYATLCGSLCFVIAFMYQRKGSKYKFIPSLVAFAIAALSGVEWLDVMGSILLYGYWPKISPVMTVGVAMLLAVSMWCKGNVARLLRIFHFRRATN